MRWRGSGPARQPATSTRTSKAELRLQGHKVYFGVAEWYAGGTMAVHRTRFLPTNAPFRFDAIDRARGGHAIRSTPAAGARSARPARWRSSPASVKSGAARPG